jgi:phage host-nuclease inhibitor protein Gam
MELRTWEDAEAAAAEYLRLHSQLELLSEKLKEFAEARRDKLARPRDLGGLLIGFRKEPPTVAIADRERALLFLKKDMDGQFIETVEEIDRAALRDFLLSGASRNCLDVLREHGISLRPATLKFFLKLARQVEG